MSKKLWILFLVSVIVLILFINCSNYNLLIADKNGHVIKKIPIKKGDKFEISFIHSSELEPWDNIFEVDENSEIVLEEMRVPSTGPGVPSVLEEGWTIDIKDGFIIYGNINKRYKSIDFIVSSISPHYLTIKGKRFNLVELTENWANIIVTVKRRCFFY